MFVALLTGPLAAKAAKPIYRCTKDGRTTLTYQPCDGSPSAAAQDVQPGTTITVSSSQSVAGEWRGQTQYQGAGNGQPLDAAHTVVPLVLAFTADGEVIGSSPGNHCQWLGVWTQGPTPRLLHLDISASSGRFSGFNRRYRGSFMATWADPSGLLTLQAGVASAVEIERYIANNGLTQAKAAVAFGVQQPATRPGKRAVAA
jgi:hypothetical protein